MQILTQPQTEHHLPFAALLPALEQMFTTGCEVPLRHHHAIPGRSADEDGILLLMPAWQTGQRLGVKTVSIFPGNARQGLPGLHSVYILYDARTGQPLAVLDGDTITSRRTAAASALAGVAGEDGHGLDAQALAGLPGGHQQQDAVFVGTAPGDG
ncbi:hypothetical protein PV794_16575, partial [Comamonas aquatica]|nr:hypothetical protein [Comamonas aquatica]